MPERTRSTRSRPAPSDLGNAGARRARRRTRRAPSAVDQSDQRSRPPPTRPRTFPASGTENDGSRASSPNPCGTLSDRIWSSVRITVLRYRRVAFDDATRRSSAKRTLMHRSSWKLPRLSTTVAAMAGRPRGTVEARAGRCPHPFARVRGHDPKKPASWPNASARGLRHWLDRPSRSELSWIEPTFFRDSTGRYASSGGRDLRIHGGLRVNSTRPRSGTHRLGDAARAAWARGPTLFSCSS